MRKSYKNEEEKASSILIQNIFSYRVDQPHSVSADSLLSSLMLKALKEALGISNLVLCPISDYTELQIIQPKIGFGLEIDFVLFRMFAYN